MYMQIGLRTPGIEHPDITWALRTGYPRWMQPDKEEYDQDAYDAYCDRCYEEHRDEQMFRG